MATRGRPTQFQIAPHAGKSWRAVVELGEDNRLGVPVDATRRAPWLGRDKAVLAVLGDDGGVRLRPYSPFGERVEAKLAELDKEGSEESERLIRAIRATRLRLKTYEDGRMIVPAEVRMALAIAPTGAAFLSLTVSGDEAALKESGPREISEAADLLEDMDLG